MTWTTIAYAFAAGILPSLLWLFFWLREDNLCPEPRLIVGIAFLLGMLSVAIAIYAESASAVFLNTDTQKYIVWAAIEEITKAIAVAVVAFFSSRSTSRSIVMVYFITAALGFAAVENSLFLINPLTSGQISASIAVGDFRFMGATLVHTVSSALVGFSIALAYYRGVFAKIVMTIIGLAAATALHSAFNLSVLSAAPSATLPVFAWIWCAVIILIVLFEEIKAVKPRISPPIAA